MSESMAVRRGFLRGLAALALSVAAAFAHAQAEQAQFKPQVGQAGKDVIWVPTPEAVAKRMLEMARVGPKDFVMDLGSGDGRIAIAAGKQFGARALGIEYNPKMVELSRKAAAKAGVSSKVQFRRADIFATDFSKATVLTLYLLPDLNLRLRPKILDMAPGTRVVSHSFSMAEWEPDQKDEVDGHQVLFWIVPANIAGSWTLQQPNGALDLSLTQNFQKIQGTAKSPERSFDLRDAKLSGGRISFALVGGDASRAEYAGRVSGKTMEGTLKASGQPEVKWSAAQR